MRDICRKVRETVMLERQRSEKDKGAKGTEEREGQRCERNRRVRETLE